MDCMENKTVHLQNPWISRNKMNPFPKWWYKIPMAESYIPKNLRKKHIQERHQTHTIDGTGILWMIFMVD